MTAQEFVRPGDRVGVPVSGGADSVALLLLLLELRDKLGIVLSVVQLQPQIARQGSKPHSPCAPALRVLCLGSQLDAAPFRNGSP
jgi:hypothetical protein